MASLSKDEEVLIKDTNNLQIRYQELEKDVSKLKQLHKEKFDKESKGAQDFKKNLKDFFEISKNNLCEEEKKISQGIESVQNFGQLVQNYQLELQKLDHIFHQLYCRKSISPKLPEPVRAEIAENKHSERKLEELTEQVENLSKDQQNLQQIVSKFLSRSPLQSLNCNVEHFLHPQPPEDLYDDDSDSIPDKCLTDPNNPCLSPRDVILNNNVLFTHNLKCSECFLSYFIEQRLLERNECEKILAADSTAGENFKFLGFLEKQTGSPVLLKTFYVALKDTCQLALANKLKPYLSLSGAISKPMIQEQDFGLNIRSNCRGGRREVEDDH